MKKIYLVLFCCVPFFSIGQNVGIGTTTPAGKLHIKGSADTAQLTIDASTTQTNAHSLIRLRSADGTDLLHINSDNPENVFIGLNTGRMNNQAGGALYNTFIGKNAGLSNSTGYSNTAVGREALLYNTTGTQNTAIGTNTLYSNSTGSQNTGTGVEALFYNTTGTYNTANGYQALYSNTTGNYNTANGSFALGYNTTGNQNTANGFEALNYNTTGHNNVAIGDDALNYNTTGNYNTANGSFALSYNTTGNQNTAIGTSALYSNTTGGYNTANGFEALYYNTTGLYNIANGLQALYSNTTGYANTANGYRSLYLNTTGINNTADGYNALLKNSIGTYNTAIGYDALSENLTGNYNIAIGAYSGTDPGSPNIQNTISIGNDGILNAANNQAFIGNTSTVWIGGNVTWSTFSDARIKTNIKENVKGLAFIMKLKPVTYFKSINAITRLTQSKETPDFPNKYEADQIVQSGFLAQDVEKAAKDANYNFSGLHIPKNSKQLYSLSYSEFVVPLVKAVQEQQKMIETQNQLIKDLEKRIAVLEAKH